MKWQKGQSGNPLGARIVERKFKGALERAIAQDDGKRLRQAAEALLTKAADGEPWAVGMLADRLDGKAEQSVTLRREITEMSREEILERLSVIRGNTTPDSVSEPDRSKGKSSEVH